MWQPLPTACIQMDRRSNKLPLNYGLAHARPQLYTIICDMYILYHKEMPLIITVHNHTQVICSYIQTKGQSERIPLTYHTGFEQNMTTQHYSGLVTSVVCIHTYTPNEQPWQSVTVVHRDKKVHTL